MCTFHNDVISSQSSNTVVVQAQPTPVVQTVYQPGSSGEYGLPALVFAIVVTAFIFFCGCWWALLCTGIGIALAIGVSPVYSVCVYVHVCACECSCVACLVYIIGTLKKGLYIFSNYIDFQGPTGYPTYLYISTGQFKCIKW